MLLIFLLFFIPSSAYAEVSSGIFAPSTAPETEQKAALQKLVVLLTQQLVELMAQKAANTESAIVPTAPLAPGVNDATTGGDVSRLQRFLTETGDYTYGEITGYYGFATRAAVERFQVRAGIVFSGTPNSTGFGAAGPKTLAVMRNRSSSMFVFHSISAPSSTTQSPGGIAYTPSYGRGDGVTDVAASSTPYIAPTSQPVSNSVAGSTGNTSLGSAAGSSSGGGISASLFCIFNGQAIANGASAVAYQAAAAPSGSSCVSETRTCVGDVLSGSYRYSGCIQSQNIATTSPPSPATTTISFFSEYLKKYPADSQRAAEALMKSGSQQLVFDDASAGAPIKVLNLSVPSNTEVLIKSGVVLMAGPSSNTADNIFRIEDVSHVSIRGESGARLTADKSAYANGEWRHHIFITSSEYITISGLTIENSGGDGIYIGSRYKLSSTSGEFINNQIKISGNKIDNNSRNGISLIQGRNIYIEDNIVSRTRSEPGTQVASHGPHAGIDVEPNESFEQLYNVRVTNNTFTDNQAFGISLSLAAARGGTSPLNVVLDANIISGSNIGISISAPVLNPGLIALRGNSIKAYGRQAIWISSKSLAGPELVISSTSIEDSLPETSWLSGGIHAPLGFSKTSNAEADGGISVLGTSIRSNKGKYLYVVDNATLIPYQNVKLGFILTDKLSTKAVYKGRGYTESAFSVSVQ
ncbi:MAG: hypothetical protein RLZZ342_443 [Candidatus Parcubacteria bacterium]|jgi:peptidoglycan hydrolase-like protein with peptidoglycan-binding domain